MGKIKQHLDVKSFVAITTDDTQRLPDIIKDLKPIFGTTDLQSEWFLVDPFTLYYENEMGRDLQKVFVSFTGLTSVGDLPRFKIETNSLEDKYLKHTSRTVNIDPGYITEAKVVLATTKDFSHRLYLGQGIFGDLHLVFREGSYRPQEWTYPDYEQELAIKFFNLLRSRYKQQIIKS